MYDSKCENQKMVGRQHYRKAIFYLRLADIILVHGKEVYGDTYISIHFILIWHIFCKDFIILLVNSNNNVQPFYFHKQSLQQYFRPLQQI